MRNDCPIGLASALFDMSDERFVREYIRTGRIHADRLHQLNWSRVLWLYNQTPERRKKHAIDEWKMKRDFAL